MDELDGRSVIVDGVSEAMGEALLDSGLSVDWRLTRMRRGGRTPLLCGDAVHGAAGLERG